MTRYSAEKQREKIIEFLPAELKNISIICTEETGSTNDEAKKLSDKYDTLVYIADSQTKGRGRMGRSFFSPVNTGIYMSILLHPELEAQMCTLITPLCAAAVCEAIENVLGIRTDIKWVNDIYFRDRKVAGILTEGSFSKEKTDYIIVGAGINLAPPQEDFPDEIKDIASFLTTDISAKERLTAEIITCFFRYFRCLPEKDFLPLYRERLLYLGEKITVISAQGNYGARVVDTDDMCRLIVETDDGKREILHSGEISIRPIYK